MINKATIKKGDASAIALKKAIETNQKLMQKIKKNISKKKEEEAEEKHEAICEKKEYAGVLKVA